MIKKVLINSVMTVKALIKMALTSKVLIEMVMILTVSTKTDLID